jgi:anti-anti-sigma factor
MTAELSATTEMLADDVYVIVLEGEIDIYTAHVLERAVSKALEDCRGAVVADLSSVSFMDSTAINSLLNARKRLKQTGGKFAVVCPDRAIGRVFEILAIGEMLTVADSRAQALALIRE